MVSFFLYIYDFFQERKRLCIILLAAVVGMLVLMVSSLRYNEDIYDFLPMDENQQKAITLYQDITGGKRIVAMIKMKNGNETNTDRLCEAVDTFTSILGRGNGSVHLENITSQVDYEMIAGVTDFAYHNIPVLLADSDYVRMEKILSSPQMVQDQLAQDVQMIMMPSTGAFATNIGNDPLGLFVPVLLRMQQKQSSLPFETENGYIFTADKQYAIVMMTSAYGSMESANNTRLVNYVDSVSAQTMVEFPDVDVAITGSPVIAVDNANQIKTDSKWAIAIAVVLILCLLVFSFRSGKNLLLIGVSILFGWLFALALIAVLRTNVSLIVLGIGSIIIGIAVNYPLHFVAHLAHGGSVREVLKEMVSPLLIGNITTVGAFASLVPLDAPALRDLGLFAAFMLIGTILFVLIFLPHLVKRDAHQGEERLLFGRLSSISMKANKWTFMFILLLTIVFGYFSLGTKFDANMHHINYLTPTQERLISDLHISAGVTDSTNVYVVAEGTSWDEALSERRQLAPLLDSLKQRGEIASFTDVTSFVNSKDAQQERINKWNTFWDVHRNEAIALLKHYAPENGFSDDAFNEFVKIISDEYEPRDFEHYSPLVSALLTQSFSSSTGEYSIVDIVKAKGSHIDHIESSINAAAKDRGYSFDFTGMNSAVANTLSDDFNYIGFACGFIVFLFLWISFGRLELSLLAFLPMAIGWLWILGIMNILGMQFNIVNVILATFIFGQGDDYTIFMTDGLINEYACKKKLLPSYKNSIIISALIMFIGMGSLIVAKHPALHSLAEVTIVGMLTVVLMAWIIPPMIFNWLTKTNGRFRSSPVTIGKILRTLYCAVAYLTEILYGCVLGFVLKIVPCRKKAKEAFFHRNIHAIMTANVNCIYGVKTNIHNRYDESFSRGSIVISNHQSILDPVLMLALSPKVLILISEKVWGNPIVHTIFKLAGFISLNQPIEKLAEEMKKAVNKGYNLVIFPEGKRNDGQISRFHKGAFHIAQEIGADILPICLHGVNHVVPRGSGLVSAGQIDIEIGKRIPATKLKEYGDTPQLMAHNFHLKYLKQYEAMRKEIENTHYFHNHVIESYIYKGLSMERETKRLLRRYDDFTQWIDAYERTKKTANNVSIINAGHGQFSIMFALVHPTLEIHSYTDNADDFALLAALRPSPKNLHTHLITDGKEINDGDIIDLSSILR